MLGELLLYNLIHTLHSVYRGIGGVQLYRTRDGREKEGMEENEARGRGEGGSCTNKEERARIIEGGRGEISPGPCLSRVKSSLLSLPPFLHQICTLVCAHTPRRGYTGCLSPHPTPPHHQPHPSSPRSLCQSHLSKTKCCALSKPSSWDQSHLTKKVLI
jgi:hypothetical protein